MSFFEPPPPQREPPKREAELPEWVGPPGNVLGAAASLQLVLVRTDEVAVAVSHATAYPTGFEFTLAVHLRAMEGLDPLDLGAVLRWRHRRGGGAGGIPPHLLRFGIQFADGSKATNLEDPFPPGPDKRPEGPVLMPRGGGGTTGRRHQDFWVWPLPPPGTLGLACEWPAKRIELTRKEIDAEVIRRAATEAETLWEKPRDHAASGTSSSEVAIAVRALEPEADERD